jgi:hypothetical protein
MVENTYEYRIGDIIHESTQDVEGIITSVDKTWRKIAGRSVLEVSIRYEIRKNSNVWSFTAWESDVVLVKRGESIYELW